MKPVSLTMMMLFAILAIATTIVTANRPWPANPFLGQFEISMAPRYLRDGTLAKNTRYFNFTLGFPTIDHDIDDFVGIGAPYNEGFMRPIFNAEDPQTDFEETGCVVYDAKTGEDLDIGVTIDDDYLWLFFRDHTIDGGERILHKNQSVRVVCQKIWLDFEAALGVGETIDIMPMFFYISPDDDESKDIEYLQYRTLPIVDDKITIGTMKPIRRPSDVIQRPIPR